MQQLPTADLVVLVVYILGVVGFGCYFVRKSRDTDHFMAAGRALPGWAVGLSIFGTYLSSNTFIGYPGIAYGGTWNRFVFSLALPIAAVIAVRFFVPFYRKAGEISAYHHLEKRFGRWARTYALICYLLIQVSRMGAVMFGVAIALNALTGWGMANIIIAMGVLVTLYTLLGGIEAVIWTDVAQSIVLVVGALVVAVMLLVGMPGGPATIFETGMEHGKFSLGSFGTSLSESTFWVVLFFGIFANLKNFGIDQSFVQRYHTARSDKAAGRSVWMASLMYMPISLLFLFIGTSLFAYYTHPDNRDLLQEVKTSVAERQIAERASELDEAAYAAEVEAAADELTDRDIGDKVLPHFVVTQLPPGLAGLLFAAIFAAAMSSIDTSLNSSATIILSDIYKRYIRPACGERESMRVLHGATLFWGAVGTGAALAMIGQASLLDTWWKLSGIFTGALLGLFLLGFMVRRAGSVAAFAGVAAGVILIAWMTFTPLGVEKVALDPQAEAPAPKLEELLAEHPKAKGIWERTSARPGGHEPTPEGYDRALAALLARSQWSDQEMANAIIASRREHGTDVRHVCQEAAMEDILSYGRAETSLWGHAPRSPFHKWLISVFGATAIVLVGFLVGLVISRRRGRDTELSDT